MKKTLKVLFLISYVALWHQVWMHNEEINDLLDRETER